MPKKRLPSATVKSRSTAAVNRETPLGSIDELEAEAEDRFAWGVADPVGPRGEPDKARPTISHFLDSASGTGDAANGRGQNETRKATRAERGIAAWK